MNSIQGEQNYEADLDRPVRVTDLGTMTAGDREETVYRVAVKASGRTVDCSEAAATAYLIRSDRLTLVWQGRCDETGVSFTLPEEAHATPGCFSLAVRLVKDGVRHTVFAAEGVVRESATDAQLDPCEAVPALDELLARLDDMAAAALTANRAALAANQAVAGIDAKIAPVSAEVSGLKDDFARRGAAIPRVTTEHPCDVIPNSYWDSQGETVIQASYTGVYYRMPAIDVSRAVSVQLYLQAGVSSKQRVWVFADKDYKALDKAPAYSGEYFHTYDVPVPHGAKYLLITVLARSQEELARNRVTLYSYAEVQAKNTALRGKRLSLLGDSISAYAGTIPEGNRAYYTGSNAGVTSADQMWWRVLCDRTGMEPLVINGWSGSCVTAGVRTDTVEASAVSRCQALHDGDTLPDVVIVAMGVNDYSYNAPLGDWDGRTTLGDDTGSFRAAYARMLTRIRQRYPAAAIVCVTPWHVQRGTDMGVTYVNGLGLTERAYADAIIEIAGLMGCMVIDGQQMGLHRYNYYPGYCEDSGTEPTHPNAAGNRVIGNAVAAQLEQMAGRWPDA